MRRAHEPKTYFRTQLFAFIERQGLEVRQTVQSFLKGVKRQRRVMFRFVVLVVERGVFFLQMARVGKKNSAEVDRCRSGVNRSAKTCFDQARNPSAVVQMGMGQDDGIYFFCRNRGVAPVAFPPVFLALK